ncbi:MAG: O-antigen ligase family protein [bacterium]|nr:O-antigen ligase family protein [bacterium]
MLWFLRARWEGARPLNMPDYLILGFFAVAGLSIFGAGIKELSIYHLFKLAEFTGLYFYVKYNSGVIFNFSHSLLAIFGAAFFQSLLAISQSLLQHGFGLKILGESPSLLPSTPGVAVFIVNGEKFMRAYGTTPHPNILAAFLLAALFSFCWIYLARLNFSKKYEKAGLVAYGIILFAFFLTFSRTMIALWGFAMFLHFLFLFRPAGKQFWKDNKKRILNVIIMTAVAILIFSAFYWPQIESRITISGDDEAVSQRIYYNKIAGAASKDNPLFGIGVGQFVPEFMKDVPGMYFPLYQPVHNIYLLILSETGYIGLGVFLLFGILVIRKFIKKSGLPELHRWSFLIFVFTILTIGLFDHFLWTLQPGRMIFWVMLGLIASQYQISNIKN